MKEMKNNVIVIHSIEEMYNIISNRLKTGHIYEVIYHDKHFVGELTSIFIDMYRHCITLLFETEKGREFVWIRSADDMNEFFGKLVSYD